MSKFAQWAVDVRLLTKRAWFEEQSKLLNNDPVKIAQELECVDGSTMIELYDNETKTTIKLPIREAYKLLSNQC